MTGIVMMKKFNRKWTGETQSIWMWIKMSQTAII